MTEEKVKCKKCGKVGICKDVKGLMRHLRLCHNISVSKKFDKEEYFEPADSESVVEIKSITHKQFRKEQNKKFTKYSRHKGSRTEHSQFVRIIYTPMTNG